MTGILGGVCSIQLSYVDSNNIKFIKRAFTSQISDDLDIRRHILYSSNLHNQFLKLLLKQILKNIKLPHHIIHQRSITI